MTGEETKRLKEKFEKKWAEEWEHSSFDPFTGGHDDWVDEDAVWQFIESEIITPYEKQLEQVEREEMITEKQFESAYETFCNYYTCPNCKHSNLVFEQNYCSDCGIKLRWDLSQNTQTK